MPNQRKSGNSAEEDALHDTLLEENDVNAQSKSTLDSKSGISDLELDRSDSHQNTRKNRTSSLSLFATVLVFGICLASLIALVGTYIKAKNKFAPTKEIISAKVPEKLKGSVFELKGIKCGWELSPDLEKAIPPSMIVPVITIKETKGNDGYLQVVFKDADGNIQGDPNTFQFESKNNAFLKQKGNRLKVRSTSGLNNMLNFSSYKIADSKSLIGPWSATIMESGSNGKWSTLSIFEIPGDELSSTDE